jgi:hypothetical protein
MIFFLLYSNFKSIFQMNERFQKKRRTSYYIIRKKILFILMVYSYNRLLILNRVC